MTAVANGEALDKQRQQEAETAAKRIRELEAQTATLKTAVAKAEALAKQREHEAEAAAKQNDELVADLFKVTSELVEMSKRLAEQTAATNKARGELDDHRSRSWWWEHGVG
jgi:uncharacterized membrane protein YccC